jgi:hypothetical protein
MKFENLKQCNVCDEIKPKTDEYFYVRKVRGGFRTLCIECEKKRAKKYYYEKVVNNVKRTIKSNNKKVVI